MYIRFGDIPKDEKSGIYRGEEMIGELNGVSVYPLINNNGVFYLGLPLPVTKASFDTLTSLIVYGNRPCYVVSGDNIGIGTDGEPLIKNVKIIKEIDYRKK